MLIEKRSYEFRPVCSSFLRNAIVKDLREAVCIWSHSVSYASLSSHKKWMNVGINSPLADGNPAKQRGVSCAKLHFDRGCVARRSFTKLRLTVRHWHGAPGVKGRLDAGRVTGVVTTYGPLRNARAQRLRQVTIVRAVTILIAPPLYASRGSFVSWGVKANFFRLAGFPVKFRKIL